MGRVAGAAVGRLIETFPPNYAPERMHSRLHRALHRLLHGYSRPKLLESHKFNAPRAALHRAHDAVAKPTLTPPRLQA
jgi:hypothetical protein